MPDNLLRAAAARTARLASGRLIARLSYPLLIGAACIWLLRDKVAHLDPTAIVTVMGTVTPAQWVAAIGATALSFWAIGTYDIVVHRHLGTGLSARKARISGAAAVAVAQVLGLGVVTGAFARWRILSGARPGLAAGVTAAVTLSFLMAWAVVSVFACLVMPGPAVPVWLASLVLFVAGSLVILAFLRPELSLGPWRLRLPSLRAMTAITLLTLIDLVAAAAALHVLFPAEVVLGFEVLVPAFIVALGAGLLSSTPGGAGPFELAMMTMLPQVPVEALLGTILAWRLVYYALPALLALIPLARPLDVDQDGSDANALPAAADSPLLARAQRSEVGVARQNNAQLLHGGAGTAIVVPTGQTLTLLFDPMTGGLRGFRALLPALKRAARDRMLSPAIYKCGARLASRARRDGWRLIRIADEAVVDTAAFNLEGSRHRQLRRKLRHADKAGVVVSCEPNVHGDLVAELGRVDADWQIVHGRPRGFSMGMYDPDYIASQRVYVARRDGDIVAFASFHVSRHEMCLDLMRHTGTLPDGTMHQLIITAIETAQADGIDRLSLAAMPAHHVQESALRNRLRQRIAARTGGTGLTRFKQSFAPRREPLYLCAPTRIGVMVAMMDLARAIRTAPLPRTSRRRAGLDKGVGTVGSMVAGKLFVPAGFRAGVMARFMARFMARVMARVMAGVRFSVMAGASQFGALPSALASMVTGPDARHGAGPNVGPSVRRLGVAGSPIARDLDFITPDCFPSRGGGHYATPSSGMTGDDLGPMAASVIALDTPKAQPMPTVWDQSQSHGHTPPRNEAFGMTYGRPDGQVGGQASGQASGRVGGQANGQADGYANGRGHKQGHRQGHELGHELGVSSPLSSGRGPGYVGRITR